jgi:hypothetical protein
MGRDNAMKRLLYTLAALATGLVLAVAPQAAQASDVSPATTCTGTYVVSHYGHDGVAICNFHVDQVDNGNGNIEYFVVGANYHIFHIWKGSNGWHDLNGISRSWDSGVWAYRDSATGNAYLTTIGTNSYVYCNDRIGGVWSGWYYCD